MQCLLHSYSSTMELLSCCAMQRSDMLPTSPGIAQEQVPTLSRIPSSSFIVAHAYSSRRLLRTTLSWPTQHPRPNLGPNCRQLDTWHQPRARVSLIWVMAACTLLSLAAEILMLTGWPYWR